MIDRIENLRKELPDDNSAFVIKSDVNRFYYTGFRSSAGCLLVTKNSATLFVDFRYYEAATKTVSQEIDVVCYNRLYESLNDVIKKQDISSVCFEDAFITVSEFSTMKDEINADLSMDINLSDIILNHRCVKTIDEVDKIIKAQKIAEKAYLQVLNYVKEGITEREIAVELEYLMKKYGAEKVAFDLIVVSGKNSSLPHGVPGDKSIHSGDFITFDIGAVYDGYHSDMTRTIAFGYATDEMKIVQ